VDHAALILGVTACFLLAGAVKGVIGIGLPVVAMGLLGLTMPTVQAAALLVVPSFVTNVWQMVAGPSLLPIVRRLFTMQLCMFLGTFAGIGFLTGSSAALASAMLGAVLVAYAVVGLLAVRFAVRRSFEPWLSPIVGLLTGLLTGATGVFVVPAVPYLASLRLEKEELIQAFGFSFTMSTVALGVGLAASGAFAAFWVGSSIFALVAALVGMLVGQRIRSRLQPEVFRRWFFVGLLLIGLYMLIRTLRVAWA